MKLFNQHRFQSLFVLASVALAGCGSSSDVQLAPVKGRVLSSGQPISGALVEFIPNTGRPSFARTEEDGSFELKHGPGLDGVVPGMHRVSVTVEASNGPRMADDGTMLAPIPRKDSSSAVGFTLPGLVKVSNDGLENYTIDVAEKSKS